MRILHLGNGNLFGGIETALVTLARLERDHRSLENHFLLSHHGRLSDELEQLGVMPKVVADVRLRHPWSVVRARRECRAHVDALKPDVVVAHGPWTYVVFGAGMRSRPPLVFFQHGAAVSDSLHWLARMRKPAGVIANSPHTASTTPGLFPGVPIQICRYPLAPGAPRRPRGTVRGELGVGAEPVVVQTSRLEPWKGQRLLIESLSRLNHLPWRLWLAGGQNRDAEIRFRRELDSMVRSYRLEERVTFLGERDDIPDLLAAADVFCQPNIEREPYGITVVEAMSAGLPIVATNLGATADEIGGSIGRRVEENPVALSAALQELLSDESKRGELGRAARRHFENNFSPAAALEALRNALESMAIARGSEQWA